MMPSNDVFVLVVRAYPGPLCSLHCQQTGGQHFVHHDSLDNALASTVVVKLNWCDHFVLLLTIWGSTGFYRRSFN